MDSAGHTTGHGNALSFTLIKAVFQTHFLWSSKVSYQANLEIKVEKNVSPFILYGKKKKVYLSINHNYSILLGSYTSWCIRSQLRCSNIIVPTVPPDIVFPYSQTSVGIAESELGLPRRLCVILSQGRRWIVIDPWLLQTGPYVSRISGFVKQTTYGSTRLGLTNFRSFSLYSSKVLPLRSTVREGRGPSFSKVSSITASSSGSSFALIARSAMNLVKGSNRFLM